MIRFDGADISQIPARIRVKIDVREDGCWHWIGARHPLGHGNTWFAGKSISAHRLMYALLVGEIEPGLLLHHQCEVPCCVNPAHLQPMTKKEHAAEHGLSGAALIHAQAVTCAKGHPFDHHDGIQRICRRCSREFKRRSAQKRRNERKQQTA